MEVETRPVSAIQFDKIWYGVDERGNNLQEVGFESPEEAKEYAANKDNYWDKTRTLQSSDASGNFYHGVDVNGNTLGEMRFQNKVDAQKYAIQRSVKANLS